MIFYFSTTGNSQWVAEQLAALTGDTAHDMMKALHEQKLPDGSDEAEVTGIVFPIHCWAMPGPVADFLKLLNSINKSSYRYAVFTCGDDCGKAADVVAKVFHIDAAWSVAMPNTYVPMFSLDSDSLCHEKISHARAILPRMAEDIATRKRKREVNEGGAAWLKTYGIKPLFDRFYVSARGFRADNACSGCGTCRKVCPVDNITLTNGRPEWGNRCIHCMACYHHCPSCAIHYKKSTDGKGQYRLNKYL